MSTETIQRLVTLGTGVLGIDIIRPDASLVLQGASSMRLMQLVALVYDEFDVFVDLSEVMGEEVTLAWIAGVVDQQRGGESGGAALGSLPEPRREAEFNAARGTETLGRSDLRE